MAPQIEDLTRSVSAKRTVASLLDILDRFLWWIPGVGDVIGYLSILFGITGLSHATVKKTLPKNIASTITSVLGLVVKAATFFHIAALYPYLAIINQLILALGGAAVATFFASKKKKK